MNIQMVDLKNQYRRIKQEVDIAIQEVIDSTSFINGPQVGLFCEEFATYLKVGKVIGCANGTDALQIALMALDLQPGDEVIVPSFTYVATAEVIALLRLTPILVEVDPDTFNLTGPIIERAITPKTKAIVPVHLFGQCADMEPILVIAEKYNLYVIEDAAQAVGAEYVFSSGSVMKAGTMGNIGCTSFFPSKNLGCYGDGGAIFTNDEKLAGKIQKIANHGQSKKYHHEVVGINSRLDTIQAAILRVKLQYLDEYSQARAAAAAYYDEQLSKLHWLQVPVRQKNSTHVFHQYTIKLGQEIARDTLKAYLAQQGIPSMIYYPLPLHQQEAYKSGRYKMGTFPIAESLCKIVLSLPMHTEMNDEILQEITSAIEEFNL